MTENEALSRLSLVDSLELLALDAELRHLTAQFETLLVVSDRIHPCSGLR